jgi:cytochrome b561
MRLTNTQRNWGTIAKLFHWLMALLVLGNLALGYWAVGLDPDASLRETAFYWHKTTGLTVLWLVGLRLLWRLANPIPGLPARTPGWQRLLARLSHFLLYLGMIAMPVSGWLVHVTASDSAFLLYETFALPEQLPWAVAESRVRPLAKLAHYWLFIALASLVAIHILGAAKHHLLNDDPVLRRMLPFTRATDPIRGE